MKYILAVLILFATSSAFAQKLYTRNDSIPITQDSVTLKAGPYRGNIQWQKSLDNQNWIILEGKTTDSLTVKPDIEAIYRAKVAEGTCLPVYSDSARIGFTVPSVLTSTAIEVIDTSAVLGGNVINNGGPILSEYGICYSITPNPDISKSKIKFGNEIGIFSNKVNGLQANTTYFVRAYAINSKGITYGEQIQFTTEKTLPFFVSKFVFADIGDTITAPDKATLIVPANALQISGDNSIGGITKDELPVIPNQNLEIFGKSYKLGLPGDSLLQSVTLSFHLETLPDPIENYVLFMYNGSSYFPIEYTISGNTVTAIIDNINWGNDTIQTLKSTKFFLSEIIIVGLVGKQSPPSDQLGLKQVSISVNGDLKFSPPTYNLDSKILLLIHGIMSSPSNAWETFIKDVTLQIPSYSKVWTFGYNSNLSIDENASILKNALDGQTKGTKVDIVAHSMGGLVSRAMIENYDGAKFVNKLITLGTPNLGSPAAAIRGLIGFMVSLDSFFSLTPLYNYETQGLRDLQTNSNFIQKMKQNTRSQVPYYLIASTNNPWKYWNLNTTWIISGPCDGVVAVSSAQGIPGCTTPSSIFIDNGMAHTHMTDINNDVYPQVLAYLRLRVPDVTTINISDVTQNSATGGGTISSNGGAIINTKGVCWSTSEKPTTENWTTSDGSGNGSFTSNLTGLTANTTYYVRAYATNSAGTAYGNQLTFTTGQAITPPTLTTNPITDIIQTSATSGGSITSNGGAAVTASGVCWSTSQDPTTATNFTTDGNTSSFTSNLSGLTANTTYYVRAYATNSAGTAYGEQVSFTTSSESNLTGTFTDSRDGKTYSWVQIGTQTWMAENLAYLPAVYPSSNESYTEPRYYVYDYQGTDVAAAKNNANYTTYGVLYNWPATLAACPPGWHLPSDAEWTALTTFLGGESVAGGKLKETGTTHWYSPNTGATNEFGFAALPAGYVDGSGFFGGIGGYGSWWSSTEIGTYNAWGLGMFGSDSGVSSSGNGKEAGLSVRCIRDDNVASVVVPTLSTLAVSSITQTTATSGGNVTSHGNATVIVRGVCWSTTTNPTISNSKTTNSSGTGSFTSSLTGLTANTTYYVMAYATNSAGTAYGNQVSFTTKMKIGIGEN